MAELLTYEQAWKKIRTQVKRFPTRCQVAVAYFGNGGSNLLPLRKGSTLVVDLSERAVRSGQTKPSEIRKLVEKGVDAYSVENLHAKVFVVGHSALVGSTNVSNSSAGRLIEAILNTSDGAVVSACRRFVLSLRGEPATPQYLKRLQELYRPPKFGAGDRKPRKPVKIAPKHATLWTLPGVNCTYDQYDEGARRRGNARAKPRLRSSRLFYVDDFQLEGSGWIDAFKRDDLVVQVIDEGRGWFKVAPPSRVLNIEPYTKEKGEGRFAMASLEAPVTGRQMSLKRVLERLPRSAVILKKNDRPRKIRDPLLTHALMNLFPSTKTS